jgi:hypothetical protein
VRHEEITDPADLATIRRALWAVEIGDEAAVAVSLPAATVTGGLDTYPACQRHARELRGHGARRLVAPSAALEPGGARGWRVDGGERPAAARDGRVIVVYGSPARFVGWRIVERGTPPADLLPRVRHFRPVSRGGRPGEIPAWRGRRARGTAPAPDASRDAGPDNARRQAASHRAPDRSGRTRAATCPPRYPGGPSGTRRQPSPSVNSRAAKHQTTIRLPGR